METFKKIVGWERLKEMHQEAKEPMYSFYGLIFWLLLTMVLVKIVT